MKLNYLFQKAVFVTGVAAVSLAVAQAPSGPPKGTLLTPQGNEVTPVSKILTMDQLPVAIERAEPVAYTLPNGETHWYETVHTPEGGINWVQAKILAEQQGGYLASVHSEAENDFIFSLVEEDKFWYKFDHGDGIFVLSGPFLGGFQPEGAAEPDGGWRWVSGESWGFERWQKAGLEIGIRAEPDDQPNNNRGTQNVLGFGEVDVPVAYWSDLPHMMSTHNTRMPSCYGFIIEYNDKPSRATCLPGTLRN